MVAPVAGSLGYSLEDTAVALGLMANSGIKGSQAGTALRSALTNLVNPTAKMEKEMEKLGINIKDSNGEMKPLDVLLGDLRGSFGKLTDDQKASSAATVFGKEAMAGMLAVINAGDADFDKLSKAIENSDGVAEDMADTMQNNLQGKLTNLKSALEELAIKIFDALEPALNAILGAIQKLVDWMNGLSKNTQLIVVAVVALVAAIGPLLLVLGPLLTMVGGLMVALPVLAPLIAGLAGPVGIVVGVLGALGAAYALTKTKADESYKAQLKESEANLEMAEARQEATEEITEQVDKTSELIEKTQEQMEVTDDLIDTYEELAEKSKLTTDEFGEFLTLQSELDNTKSPERIAEIEERMEKLREKSGMSKDEFKRLIETNEDLAEMFPEVGQVVDDYGNVIMDTTGKLRDMTNAELERMQLQVYNQMIEDLQTVNGEIDDYNELLGETLELEDSVAQSKKEVSDIQKDIKSNEDGIKESSEEILELQEKKKDASFKEWWELDKQVQTTKLHRAELEEKNRKNEKNLGVLEGTLEVDEKNLATNKKTTDEIGEHIDKNMQNYDLYVEILGKQLDVNIEKGKENESIDKAIEKRQKEITQLEDKIKKEGDSNGKLQESVDHLKTENTQLEDAKTKLDGINKNLDTQTTKYDKANNELAKVNTKFTEAGGLTDENIKKADIWNGKLDKNHTKDVKVKTNKDADKENEKWKAPISKTVNVLTSGLSKLKFWAKGTNFHPGGKAVLGEEGSELVEHNGKMSLANFGMYDLPMGAKVHTADDTVNMLRNGLVSGIGKGISLQEGNNNSKNLVVNGNNEEVINALNEQNNILMKLLNKEVTAKITRNEVGQATDEYQGRQVARFERGIVT